MRSFLRVLSVILLVAWMGLIFFFSHQPADVSSETSGSVIEIIAQKIYPDFENLSIDEQAKIIEDYQFIVRKGTHIGIYFGLGFFAFLTFVSYTKLRFFVRMLFSLLTGVFYAAGDEYHQSFILGRSGELRDFLLDSAGVLFAVLLCTAFVKIIPPLRRKTAFAGLCKNPVVSEFDSSCEQDLPLVAENTLIEEINEKTEELGIIYGEEEMPIEETQPTETEEVLPMDEIETTEENDRVETILLEETVSEEEVKPKKEIKLTDEMEYAASVIGKAVVKATKVCNRLTANEQDETRKELVNLTLGRTEVLKGEILGILNQDLPFEDKKILIEKACQNTYDYFDSIIAQIS